MADRACRLLYLWLLITWLALELFLIFDWDHGLARAALLGFVAGLLWLYRTWAGRFRSILGPSRSWTRIARAALLVGVLANLGPGAFFLWSSHRTHRVRSDQAQTVLDALNLLGQGVNPYAADTVTDRIGHAVAVDTLASQPSCGESAGPVSFRVGRADDRVIPSVAATKDCDPIRRLFTSLGFKYGPFTLLFYWPFVTLFGPAGFVVSHLLLMGALGALLLRWAHEESRSPFWATTALLLYLWPTQLAWNTVGQEHLDLLPVFLCMLGWYCRDRGRFGAAAACLGISLATKVVPALLFLPLLAGAPRRVWAVPAAMALAFIAPFAIWDWTGFWHNVGYPFMRPPDSTAAAFFLTTREGTMLRMGSLLAAAALGARAHRLNWSGPATVEYLIFTHLLVLASGTTFHNNYLLWLLPLLSLYMVMQVVPTQGVRSSQCSSQRA